MKSVIGLIGSTIMISIIAVPTVIHGPAFGRVLGTAALLTQLMVLFYTIKDAKKQNNHF